MPRLTLPKGHTSLLFGVKLLYTHVWYSQLLMVFLASMAMLRSVHQLNVLAIILVLHYPPPTGPPRILYLSTTLAPLDHVTTCTSIAGTGSWLQPAAQVPYMHTIICGPTSANDIIISLFTWEFSSLAKVYIISRLPYLYIIMPHLFSPKKGLLWRLTKPTIELHTEMTVWLTLNVTCNTRIWQGNIMVINIQVCTFGHVYECVT